ncbi:MAG TPA: hypothetical protein VKQ52_00975 [Puia sp.]|nr:hypothetical protein [Puia sp.]
MKNIVNELRGGDRCSIGKVDAIISEVSSRAKFDELFECLFNADYLVTIRAADD